jgi:glutaredoxin
MCSIARYDRRVTLKLLALLLALAAATSVSAQQYRWLDEKGRVHYTDTAPPPSARNAQKKNLRGNAVGQQQSYELSQAMKASPVKLYSHPDCKDPCQRARDVLNRRGVPFTEISAVDDKLDELKRVSGSTSVPVLVVGSQVETSPTAEAYDQALNLAGYPAPGVVPPGKQAAPAAVAKPPAEEPASAR